MNERTLTDTQIKAAFVARSEGSISHDLADRIHAEATRTRQASRLVALTGGLGGNANTQRLLWAAAISATSLALVGGLLLAGRQPDDQTSVIPSSPPSPSAPAEVPSPTPDASEQPSPSSAPTPSVDPSGPPPVVDPELGVDDGAVTLVGDLRVRSLPTVGESSARLEPLLPAGMRLLVIDEPVEADGYVWYHVLPFSGTYPRGWVAAGSREGESWIGADATPCPEAPLGPSELTALGTFGGLACYGDQEIQLTGELECVLASVDRFIAGPSWLHDDRICTLDLGESVMEIQDSGMNVTYEPGRSNGTITGHFADPESSSCGDAAEDVDPPSDPVELVATCRAMFVGTDWESVPID
jgi:hypothetical protein